MTSRPFNTSSKEPMSVKLRELKASKTVTRQLEIDSRRMEERLRELKVAMNREKQERERQGSAGSGGIWSSGKVGALTTHGNDIVKKKGPAKPAKSGETKVRKIKVLKDTPLEVPKRAPKKYPDPINSVRKSFSGPACGQCEERAVALTCMECGEHYCTACFAKFHLKGALRQHRSIPFHSGSKQNSPQNSVSASSNYNDANMNNIKPPVPKTTSGADSHSKKESRIILTKTSPRQNSSPNTGTSSLFDGEYNEEESAASFAAALAEWRQAKKEEQPKDQQPDSKKDVHDMGIGTTTVNDSRVPVDIHFEENAAVSYADRLLLKKHRRTELPTALSPSPSQLANQYLPRGSDSRVGHNGLTNGHSNRSDEELEMEEEHQRYANLFAPSKDTPPAEMDRPKSNMTIMEITDEDAVKESDMEVESVYSVQEWDPDTNELSPRTTIMGSKMDNREFTIAEVDEDAAIEGTPGAKSTALPSVTEKKSAKGGRGDSAEKGKTVSATSASKETRSALERRKEKGMSSTSRIGSGQTSKVVERRESQSGKSREGSKFRQEKPKVPASEARVASGVQQQGEEKRVKSSRSEGRKSATERPQSAGITTAPSLELKEIGRLQVPWQHQQGYSEGLETFFMGGVTPRETENPRQKREDEDRVETPTNVLPECSYKGPSSWRPDSSRSIHPDQPLTAFSPSPPKQGRDSKSSSHSVRKRSSVGMANGTASASSSASSKGITSASESTDSTISSATSSRAMSSKPRSGVTSRTPRSSANKAKAGGAATGARPDSNTMHWRLSQQEKEKQKGSNLGKGDHSASSSASSLLERSSSRIEVDGDDLTSYDDAGRIGEQDVEDKETLEQLTWELASNEGRITADGRISSMSLLLDDDEKNILAMGEEEQDLALGIGHDDGMGSGLSTPCHALSSSLDRLSEEELRSDFEVAADNQRYRNEVEALDS